jgi:hypothetical protein
VFDGGRRLRLGSTVWDCRILFQNLLVSIERVRLFGPLGERFVLHHRLRVFSFSLCEVFGPVVVVLHVCNSSTKRHLQSNLTFLDWIRSNIGWLDDNFSRVFFAAKVFLDLDKVSHVGIRSRVKPFLDAVLRSEWFLVTIRNLYFTIFLPNDIQLWVGILFSNCIVARALKEHFVDSCAFLDRIGYNVAWVSNNFLWIFTIWIASRCKKKTSI